jgi:hypothetical protein
MIWLFIESRTDTLLKVAVTSPLEIFILIELPGCEDDA